MLGGSTEEKSYKLHKLLNGSIIVLALLTVLEGEALTEWSAMATILITLTATGVADAFTRGLADEIAHHRQPTLAEAAVLLRGSAFVAIPAIVPALAFAAVRVGWLTLGSAFVAACWLLIFLLCLAGYLACANCNGRHWRGLIYGLIIGGFGLGIVALRLMTP